MIMIDQSVTRDSARGKFSFFLVYVYMYTWEKNVFHAEAANFCFNSLDSRWQWYPFRNLNWYCYRLLSSGRTDNNIIIPMSRRTIANGGKRKTWEINCQVAPETMRKLQTWTQTQANFNVALILILYHCVCHLLSRGGEMHKLCA